ncbi:uncharacterized protein RAG0_12737 [Rhynchosporium agropyri]|uniref:Uncharacterized protein n=1 Tax=Rhynchosporium agropyri TaxID=914238 RepID=A0A1E1L9P8_9HELO|nr:uncharacterized protein RAG0_12737 [Rhynchosporium agropyri]
MYCTVWAKSEKECCTSHSHNHTSIVVAQSRVQPRPVPSHNISIVNGCPVWSGSWCRARDERIVDTNLKLIEDSLYHRQHRKVSTTLTSRMARRPSHTSAGRITGDTESFEPFDPYLFIQKLPVHVLSRILIKLGFPFHRKLKLSIETAGYMPAVNQAAT